MYSYNNNGNINNGNNQYPKELERYVKNNMPIQEVYDMKRIFDMIDRNRTGMVDMKELKAVFLKIGIDARQSQITEIMNLIDGNNSN
jgi:Ca2+-binding EF-hand superfamily protein